MTEVDFCRHSAGTGKGIIKITPSKSEFAILREFVVLNQRAGSTWLGLTQSEESW